MIVFFLAIGEGLAFNKTMKYKGIKKPVILSFVAGMLVMGMLLAVLAYAPNFTKEETTKPVEVLPLQPVWYENHHIIKHALGSIDGKTGTNTISALQENYLAGERLFEVDLNVTSDGEVVLHHDWEESGQHYLQFLNGIPSHEEFKQNYKYYKYPASDLKDLISYMDNHVDAMFVIDTKYTDEIPMESIIEKMVAYATEHHKLDVLDRMIIQFYSEEQYANLKAIHPFKHYMYSLYKEKNKDFEAVSNFCATNQIPTVLMKHSWVKDETSLLPFIQQGVKVYLYTTNQLSQVYEKQALGAYGFVSDHLQESDLQLKQLLDAQQRKEVQP